MNVFFQSLRVPFVSVTLSGVLLGTATAFFVSGRVDLIPFLVVAFVVITGHVSANLFNDYFDHRSGNDVVNKNITPLSGGSRAIQEGGLSESKVLLSACIFLTLSVIAGCWFVYVKQNMNLAYFGLAGLVLGYAYTAPPFKLVYRGLGELTIIITFGLFIVGGAYLAQTGDINGSAIAVSLPAGLLTAVILIVNGFPDRVADEASKKRTFVIHFGKEITILLIERFVSLSYLVVIGSALFDILPLGALACLLSLPIAVQFLKKVDRIEEDFLPAGITAIALQISFVLSTTLGIAISTFLA